MKISIKNVIAGLMVVPLMALSLVAFAPAVSRVGATVCSDGTTVENGAACSQPNGTPNCLFGKDCAFTQVTNAALYVIGAVSVLMLIYGGIRYTISGGNEKDVVAAKNTVLYAIVGIVVALLAFAIVNWVLGVLVNNN